MKVFLDVDCFVGKLTAPSFFPVFFLVCDPLLYSHSPHPPLVPPFLLIDQEESATLMDRGPVKRGLPNRDFLPIQGASSCLFYCYRVTSPITLPRACCFLERCDVWTPECRTTEFTFLAKANEAFLPQWCFDQRLPSAVSYHALQPQYFSPPHYIFLMQTRKHTFARKVRGTCARWG